RVVALGDIHGDYKKLVSILRHAKLIDQKNNWIGYDSILVQVGDLMDRASDIKKIWDLLIKLRKQATKKGGIVYLLLGNHELSNIQQSNFFISKKDVDSFGGISAREESLSMDGKYGPFVRGELNITMIIDDTLYSHAGLRLNYAQMGIDEINNSVHEVFTTSPSYDELYDNYYSQGISHPLYTHTVFDYNNGPLWNRFFSDEDEKTVCTELEEVLQVTNTKRMVIGHTVQDFGEIHTRCDNKLILIDLGLSRCISDTFGYLEIL
ncbi:hypothetical protein PIROE2DRAFT_31150, partial [Piromyces sp. E2]